MSHIFDFKSTYFIVLFIFILVKIMMCFDSRQLSSFINLFRLDNFFFFFCIDEILDTKFFSSFKYFFLESKEIFLNNF